MDSNIIDAKVYETIQKLRDSFTFSVFTRRIVVNKGVFHEFEEITSHYGKRGVIDIVNEEFYSDKLKTQIDAYCNKGNLKLLRLFPADIDCVETLVIKFIVKDLGIKSEGIKLIIAKMIIEKLKDSNVNKGDINELEELLNEY